MEIWLNRPVIKSKIKAGQVDKGNYDHFMQKEIFEQPQAIRDTLESRITNDSVITLHPLDIMLKKFSKIQSKFKL